MSDNKPDSKPKVRSAPCTSHIEYSDRYADNDHEYRHVILPADIASRIPKGKLMTEAEWRSYGVQQSRGWVHYAIHRPEPHILLFKRPLAQTKGL